MKRADQKDKTFIASITVGFVASIATAVKYAFWEWVSGEQKRASLNFGPPHDKNTSVYGVYVSAFWNNADMI